MTKPSSLLPASIGAVLGSAYALSHVFERGEWMPFAVLCTVAAFGLGESARRLAVPAVLAPAVSLVGLALLASWVFQGGSTWFGVPTLETMRLLGEQLGDGFTDIRELAAPVDSNDALTLIAGGGVFIVAMVVDQIVFTARRPVGAGLPLLVLYIVPASMRDGIGAVPFVVASLAFVALLVAEGRERARGWGRRLVGVGIAQELTDTSPVSRIGRRLGLAAVSLALIAPVLTPDLGQGLIDPSPGSGSGFGDGPSTVSVINPYVQLKPQLRSEKETVLLRVRTASPQFLRLTSLDRFDGAIWSPGRTSATKDRRVRDDRDLPEALGLDADTASTATARIQVEGLKSNWLPVPFAPRRVDIDDDWRYESSSQTVFSTRTDTEGKNYTVTSVVPAPDAAELRDAGVPDDKDLAPYLQLPPRRSQLVAGALEEATAGAETPYEQVVAIQDYFQGGGRFTYSLEVDALKDTDDVDAFLLARQGYCEQFSATMAYMVRLLGLPARVAIGFTPGNLLEGEDDVYVITNKHAHAWPEVYFEDAGWLRFEPTPRSDERAQTEPPAYALGEGGGVGPAPNASAEPSAAPTASTDASAAPGGDNDPSDRLGDEGADAPKAGGSSTTTRRGGLVLTLLAALAATPALVRLAIHRRRQRRAVTDAERIHAAWMAMADDAEDAGYRLRPSDTPRSAARRLAGQARLSVGTAEQLDLLARAEERARYARACPDPAGLPETVRDVRRALVAYAPLGQRLRARVLPRSTVRQVVEASGGLLDATISLRDRTLRGLARRLRPGAGAAS
ncbi:MAG TPA: DUF3488 and transglutaminase-like domain-containing protein [Mycobacteriales bacterium]|nr:DUF3488 and transglutaminase-like domain-containing protein [Mycobacteriales bacterium]